MTDMDDVEQRLCGVKSSTPDVICVSCEVARS